MKIAILPWNEGALNNRMFHISETGLSEEDVYTRIWKEMQEWFIKNGHQMETIDRYNNWKEIDYIIIHNGMHQKYTRKFLSKGLENKLIYRAYEPEVVNPMHSKENIRKLLRYYKYIITWNGELVDNKRIFLINTLPYIFKENFGDMPFCDRKLLVGIFSNKTSLNKNELYSERRKIFEFFENVKDEFDLYGYGWDKEEYHNYRGTVDNKSEVYHKYKFALAFENVKDTIGGVSEKIYDCICAGIVPIYYGSKTIEEYVPGDVFIDYRKFKDINEMYYFLKNMDESIYLQYIEAAKKYLQSDLIKKVGIEGFCEELEDLMKKNPAENIKCKLYNKVLYNVDTILKECKQNVKRKLVKIRKYVKEIAKNK